MVKFRRTGESSRSEDEHVDREGIPTSTSHTHLDPAGLDSDGASVPREFANPTDGTNDPYDFFFSNSLPSPSLYIDIIFNSFFDIVGYLACLAFNLLKG